MYEWQDKIVMDFCKEHGVILTVEEDVKLAQVRVVMRRPSQPRAVTRYIDYCDIWTLLPTPLLNAMLRELDSDEEAVAILREGTQRCATPTS